MNVTAFSSIEGFWWYCGVRIYWEVVWIYDCAVSAIEIFEDGKQSNIRIECFYCSLSANFSLSFRNSRRWKIDDEVRNTALSDFVEHLKLRVRVCWERISYYKNSKIFPWEMICVECTVGKEINYFRIAIGSVLMSNRRWMFVRRGKRRYNRRIFRKISEGNI